MRKRIEIAYSRDAKTFKIKMQTHIEHDFYYHISECEHSDVFTSSTGFRLCSRAEPQLKEQERLLYVRGFDTNKNHKILVYEHEDTLNNIIKAVEEYNKMHGGNTSTSLVKIGCSCIGTGELCIRCHKIAVSEVTFY